MRDEVGEEARLLIFATQSITSKSLGNKTDDEVSNNMMLRFALERQLEIIGEASSHLSPGLKAQTPDVDWINIKAFRNIIAREYFGISLGVILKIIRIDIPEPEPAIEQLLKK